MPAYSKHVDVPGKSSQDLYETISREIEKLMSKIPGEVKIERDPQKRQLQLNSSMITATLYCRDGRMELNAKLSLMATPFRSKIDAAIDKWVSKTFKD